jgi:formylmethanofuran dehydrogenase subunit E
VNLETDKAFRVISTEESRALASVYAPEISEKSVQQLEAYKRMPDSVLFQVQEVSIDVRDCDLPGPTRYKEACVRCGQVVRDRREVLVDGRPHCAPCAGGAYFRNAVQVTWPGMDRSAVLPIAENCEDRERHHESRTESYH